MSNVFVDFLEDKGLYDSIEISFENIGDFIDLLSGNVRLDVYCPKCSTKRVFFVKPLGYYKPLEGDKFQLELLSKEIKNYRNILDGKRLMDDEQSFNENWEWVYSIYNAYLRIIDFNCYCAMDENHKLNYIVEVLDNKLTKIGQYPTYADLSNSELEDYKKVLPEEELAELKRATGLYASGIGVGSYVYLRRVFEKMIEKAQDKAVQEGISKDKFSNLSMENRVKILKDYLPEFLVNNKQIYGIISKGIHELSEKKCIEYFPVMYKAITMILKEWKDKIEAEDQKQQLVKEINKIGSIENNKEA